MWGGGGGWVGICKVGNQIMYESNSEDRFTTQGPCTVYVVHMVTTVMLLCFQNLHGLFLVVENLIL